MSSESNWNDRSSSSKDSGKEGSKAWGILMFALIGATATTATVTHLRRTFSWFCNQFSKSPPFSSWTNASDGPKTWNFREEAWKRYNRRMQEEFEEEMERVERIRRMQSVFNRERNKYKRGYESWGERGPGAYQQYQHFQRDDWYWKTDTSYRRQREEYSGVPPSRDAGSYAMSHNYSVLGLDRSRGKPYSDAEIKTAFRAKAMEYHPDQNQDKKESAEAKFKEVMMSYEAIKLERKNMAT